MQSNRIWFWGRHVRHIVTISLFVTFKFPSVKNVCCNVWKVVIEFITYFLRACYDSVVSWNTWWNIRVFWFNINNLFYTLPYFTQVFVVTFKIVFVVFFFTDSYHFKYRVSQLFVFQVYVMFSFMVFEFDIYFE